MMMRYHNVKAVSSPPESRFPVLRTQGVIGAGIFTSIERFCKKGEQRLATEKTASVSAPRPLHLPLLLKRRKYSFYTAVFPSYYLTDVSVRQNPPKGFLLTLTTDVMS